MQKPTRTTRDKFYVYKHLAAGKENARTARELAGVLGEEPRTITKQIERERRHAADIGVIICAEVNGEDRGYFIASSAAEAKAYCGVLEHREGELRKTREALESMLSDEGIST